MNQGYDKKYFYLSVNIYVENIFSGIALSYKVEGKRDQPNKYVKYLCNQVLYTFTRVIKVWEVEIPPERNEAENHNFWGIVI